MPLKCCNNVKFQNSVREIITNIPMGEIVNKSTEFGNLHGSNIGPLFIFCMLNIPIFESAHK